MEKRGRDETVWGRKGQKMTWQAGVNGFEDISINADEGGEGGIISPSTAPSRQPFIPHRRRWISRQPRQTEDGRGREKAERARFTPPPPGPKGSSGGRDRLSGWWMNSSHQPRRRHRRSKRPTPTNSLISDLSNANTAGSFFALSRLTDTVRYGGYVSKLTLRVKPINIVFGKVSSLKCVTFMTSVEIQEKDMITSANGNQYLKPDYLSPMPTSVSNLFFLRLQFSR